MRRFVGKASRQEWSCPASYRKRWAEGIGWSMGENSMKMKECVERVNPIVSTNLSPAVPPFKLSTITAAEI